MNISVAKCKLSIIFGLKLEANLQVGGSLYLQGTGVTSLPDGLQGKAIR